MPLSSSTPTIANKEREITVSSGLPMLLLVTILWLTDAALAYLGIVHGPDRFWLLTAALLMLIFVSFLSTSFFSLQPNEARVLLLFGEYKGTVRQTGFYWVNPFYSAGRLRSQSSSIGEAATSTGTAATSATSTNDNLSLRARTLNGQILKVNDQRGNPVEIAAVIVWRIHDTAQALFDVDNYQTFVVTQSESALRHLASLYPYDPGEEPEITLRTHVEEISQALRAELQERLARAGVTVDDARLTHLAYAPEIAQAMLRRQQAEAVIAARQKIVHGAVSMVEMALRQLAQKQVVALDDERKAAMVSNLMVVLCAESEVHPVINTGTLYQ